MNKTKIDIYSGFLGAGKTTLIKKMIAEAFSGEKIVLIENEFGEIGIDGGFLKDAGVNITEMNSGCICCSLVGDFGKALQKVLNDYHPDRILIEPSGVGKLSDVIKAVQNLNVDNAELNSFTAVADVNKCKMYVKNFGEFYNDQISHAGCIVLSHTAGAAQAKIDECVAMLRTLNPTAVIVVTPWDKLDGMQILEAMERKNTLNAALELLKEEAAHSHHPHDDDDDEDEHECCHHHHHDDDDDENEHECCHHHHHHDEDDDDDEHEGHHHHHHDEDDDDDEHECHHHHHHDEDDDDDEHECCHHHHDDDDDHDHECCHHHHHHHADEVFTSWGRETTKTFGADALRDILTALNDTEKYGMVLRAKGIVAGSDGQWIHFDYVPGEPDVRFGSSDIIGRLCVIGSHLNEDLLAELFGV